MRCVNPRIQMPRTWVSRIQIPRSWLPRTQIPRIKMPRIKMRCRKRQRMSVIGILSLMVFLSACSPYRTQFDCPHGDGVRCQSLSAVNEMVNDGKLGPKVPRSKSAPALQKDSSIEVKEGSYVPVYFPGSGKTIFLASGGDR